VDIGFKISKKKYCADLFFFLMRDIQYIGFGILTAFYITFFLKVILQKIKGIKSARLITVSKRKSVLICEVIIRFLSFFILPCQILCVFLDYRMLDELLIQVVGIFIGFFSIGILLVSLLTVDDNKNNKISKNNDISLVTNGVYKSLYNFIVFWYLFFFF
jgi:protein-S-isoprenylcysteine O-methyltransferase Ste14